MYVYSIFLLRIRDLHVHVKEEHPEKDKSCISCGHLCDSRHDLDKHIQVLSIFTKKKNLKLEFQIFVFYFRFTRLEHLDQNRFTFAITVVRYFYVNMVCLYIKEIFIQPFPKVWNVVIAAKILKMPNF